MHNFFVQLAKIEYNTQGCGAGTQISGSGSSSGHLNFLNWLRLQHLEVFSSGFKTICSKKSEKRCIIYITRLPQKLYLWNPNPNFRLRLHSLATCTITLFACVW